MNTKLENKLLQYEKSTPISNDEELIKAIESIIRDEESVPPEERDFDLIDEAVDALLSLRKVDIEQLEECAEKITDKCLYEVQTKDVDDVKKIKRKSVRLKWIIPIAALLSLLIVGSMVAYAFGFDVISMTKEAFTQLAEKVNYKNDNKELIITEDFQTFNSIQQLLDSDDYSNLLLTSELDQNYHVEFIEVNDFGSYKDIIVRMESDGDTYKIYIDTPGTRDFPNLQPQKIGKFDVYISEYDDVHQGEFVYNGGLYTIVTSSYENLKKIIESLE